MVAGSKVTLLRAKGCHVQGEGFTLPLVPERNPYKIIPNQTLFPETGLEVGRRSNLEGKPYLVNYSQVKGST